MLFLLLLPALLQKPTTAIVRGKVTAADTGTPVKRAQITLRPMTRPLEAITINADAAGVYEVKNLEAGTYHAVCSKTGYVPMGYKAKRASDDPETLTLTEGQVLKDVDFQLPRGAVIAGTITDEDGDPIAGVNVQAMPKTYKQAASPAGMHASIQTDDLGHYRIYDLPAGRYYVQAGGKNLMAMAMSIAQSMTGGGAASPYSTVMLYPNATRTSDAQALTVRAGAIVEGINIRMRPSFTYKVSGKVMDLRAAKPASGAMLMVSGEDLMQSAAAPTQTRPDGTFHLEGLASGHYQMMIMNTENPATGGMPVIRGFDVAGADVTNLNINLGPGSLIKGRLKADGGTVPEESRVVLVPKDEGNPMPGGFTKAKADGSFEIPDVQPGTYELSVTAVNPAAASFYLRDITVDGRDVSESGIMVPELGNVDVSAMLDFHGGTITGNVTSEDGQPMERVTVVRVSADAKKRKGDRYFEHAATDSKGAFKMSTVIPGDYFLVIWPEEHPEQLQDSEIFQLVEKFVTRVSVRGSATSTQDLKLDKELRTVAQTFAQ